MRVYSSIIIGKLLYAVSSWWGFASAADRQRLQALFQRVSRSGLCSLETPNLTELAESVDDTLFQRIMHNPYHVLYHSSLNSANLYITSDQDITIGNYIVSIGQLSPVSCANGILFIVCCSKTY